MVNKIDIEVGRPFSFDEETFTAVKQTSESCGECSFDGDVYFCSKYECIGAYRQDKTNVIFKEYKEVKR